MNREQMRAALKSINAIETADKAVSIGTLVAKAQAWAIATSTATLEGGKGVVDGIAIGYMYQRALDQRKLVK